MRVLDISCEDDAANRRGGRAAFTLVEILVVLVIISMLLAILLPALNAAREAGRQSACQSNLRQIGIGLQDHASLHGTFATGAFDWARDGSVTEVGWVADLVNAGIPVGKMLCPSNPAQISEAYNQLMTLTGPDGCGGVPLAAMLGGNGTTLPDGTTDTPPCRTLLEDPAMTPGSEARRELIEKKILAKFYNTNYTASWLLVRSGVQLTRNGNLAGCDCDDPADGTASRRSTLGPLSLKSSGGPQHPSSVIPLLACGGPGESLAADIGDETAGDPTARSFTRGPVLTQDVEGMGSALFPPGPFKADDSEPDDPDTPEDESAGTPMAGPIGVGWYATWNSTRQDYRRFAPVHRRYCNVLFADGSVRSFRDTSKDEVLNNGFPALPDGGFADDTVELPDEDVFSGWDLRAK